jgi:hypothetical protein
VVTVLLPWYVNDVKSSFLPELSQFNLAASSLPHNPAQFSNLSSSSATRASTSPSPPSHPSQTPSTAPGARKPSRATSATTSKISGRSTMPQSS